MATRFLSRRVNFKGELFSSTFTFGLNAAIRLGSSLVLTRMLSPEAYGIFGILFSLLFMIELMSDVGTKALLIRHHRGADKRFIHTLWTVRLLRSCFSFCVMFFGAPLIASLYSSPVLSNALRALSPVFLLSGVESMSFILATRDQRARIANYADLASTAVMTVFVIAMAAVLHNFYCVILGALLQRIVLVAISYCYYREVGVGIAFDREAIAEQFRFARYVTPSSVLYIVLTQYDKIVFLKLFNLTLLGVYSIAGNMASPITGVVLHNAQVILFARCAEYFRSDAAQARARYYRENRRLMLIGIGLPALRS
jgi:lipopolysaccharide exporter